MNIADRKKLLERIWRLEDTSKIGYHVIDTSPRPNPVTEKEMCEQPHKLFNAQLGDIERNLQYPGHYIPQLIPYTFLHIVTSAFGARVRWADENTPPWSEPVISVLDDSVFDICKPALHKDCILKAFEWVRFFIEKNSGKHGFRAINLQSPMTNVAGLLGDHQFLTSLYDSPRQVKHLLQIVTELMIGFVKKEITMIGSENFANIYSYPDWLPPGFGIGIADDYLAVISPEMYREFALPFNNQLSEHFNGLFIHSCGRIEDRIDILHEHHNFRGINFEASDNDIRPIIEALSGKAVIAPHPGLHCREKFGGLAGYVDAFIKEKRPDTAIILTLETNTYNPKTNSYARDETLQEALGMLEDFNGKSTRISSYARLAELK